MGEPQSDKHAGTRRFVEIWCDNLRNAGVDWASASDPTRKYNCFGFVLGHDRWCQEPIEIDGVIQNPSHYWPKGASTDGSIDAYTRAAEIEHFVVSPDAAWGESFETIMLYFDEKSREFKHAARQKSPGVWESKLGSGSDIEHPFDGVDAIQYGRGRVYMKRPWPIAEPTPSVRGEKI